MKRLFVLALLLLAAPLVLAFNFVLFSTSYTPLASQTYGYGVGRGNHVYTLANSNNQTMTVTVGNWTGLYMSWATAKPTSIAANSSATITADCSAPAGTGSPVTEERTASVSWSVGGESGTATLTATWTQLEP